MNPFTPTFGIVPSVIEGRDEVIKDIVDALSADVSNPNLTTLLVGPRGCGKTAMLTLLSETAASKGWLVVNTTCISGMLNDILEQAVSAASRIFEDRSGKHLTSFSLAGFGLEWDNPQDNADKYSGSFRLKLSEILEKLAEYDSGILFTVDEVDPNLQEMVMLAAVYQHFVRENRRVGLLMAGLPYKISLLLRNESVSFLRRAKQRDLRNLTDYETESSLNKTIAEAGKSIDRDALAFLTKQSNGFPYMIQLIGYNTWEHSDGNIINLADARYGVKTAQAEIKERIYRTTYMELSPGDINFLVAMLEDKGASNVSDIAKRLNKTPSYIAQYKRRLMLNGIIREKRRSYVEFCLPGFKQFLIEEEKEDM